MEAPSCRLLITCWKDVLSLKGEAFGECLPESRGRFQQNQARERALMGSRHSELQEELCSVAKEPEG